MKFLYENIAICVSLILILASLLAALSPGIEVGMTAAWLVLASLATFTAASLSIFMRMANALGPMPRRAGPSSRKDRKTGRKVFAA